MQGTVFVVLMLIISCSAQKKEEESILEKIMKKLGNTNSEYDFGKVIVLTKQLEHLRRVL